MKPAAVAMFPQAIGIGVFGKNLPSWRIGVDVAIVGDLVTRAPPDSHLPQAL